MPEIPFNPQIPKIGERLSTSQEDLLENFQGIGTFIPVNHVDFNNGADSGKHNVVQMQTLPAGPPEGINGIGLLFVQNPPFPIAPAPVLNYSSPDQANPGGYSITYGNPLVYGAPNETGFFIVGSNIIVRWGPIRNLPDEAGLANIVYAPNVNIPPFAAGSNPSIFINYALRTVVPNVIPPLQLFPGGTSTPAGFNINKRATVTGQFAWVYFLAIGII